MSNVPSGMVTRKDFASIYGCSKAYVSQLVAARRIVLSEDGRLVDAERSLELLGATSDPSKAGVRERWAAYRAQQVAPGANPEPGSTPHSQPAPKRDEPEQRQLLDEAPSADDPAPATPPARSDYQQARTRREQAEAEMAQIELLKLRGQVLDAEPTLRAVMAANLAVCNELLGLADRVTPLVAAETVPRRVREIIQAEAERLCERVRRAAQQMAGQPVEVVA